jgi:hypothetical protein
VTGQPTLTDEVVWLTPFSVADAVAIGDLNLDDDHRRWFDQPPVDPDPEARRKHGEEVALRWQPSLDLRRGARVRRASITEG